MDTDVLKTIAIAVFAGILLWTRRKQLVTRKLEILLFVAAILVEVYAETRLTPGTPARMAFFWLFAALLTAALLPALVRFVKARPRSESSD